MMIYTRCLELPIAGVLAQTQVADLEDGCHRMLPVVHIPNQD